MARYWVPSRVLDTGILESLRWTARPSASLYGFEQKSEQLWVFEKEVHVMLTGLPNELFWIVLMCRDNLPNIVIAQRHSAAVPGFLRGPRVN